MILGLVVEGSYKTLSVFFLDSNMISSFGTYNHRNRLKKVQERTVEAKIRRGQFTGKRTRNWCGLNKVRVL